MARPLWSDAGVDPAQIAVHLAELADTAGAMRFAPRALPEGATPGMLHRAAMLRARSQLTSAHGEQDRILAQEVRAIDDLVRSANLLVERLREWYALHSPEAVRMTQPKQLADLVAHKQDRADVMAAIEGLDAVSLGSELPAPDVAVLRGFASGLHGLHDAWEALDRRVTDLMQEVAPNLASVTGPVLGARLIAQAGSLQRLAGFPAGTVQTLGAETALFRHIKEGTKPPKHGILFQHPKVHSAKPWQRGAVARALALHAGLAAKADAYTQNDLRPLLAERLAADMEIIATSRAKPPARQQRGPPGRGPPRGPPSRGPPSRGPPRGPPRDGRGFGERKPAGKYEGRSSGPSRGPSTRGPPRSGERDDRRDDRKGGFPPRKKGPGAFRKQGDGPAKPPGGKK